MCTCTYVQCHLYMIYLTCAPFNCCLECSQTSGCRHYHPGLLPWTQSARGTSEPVFLALHSFMKYYQTCILLQFTLFRAEFDSSQNAHILTLSRLLVLFYREEKDHSRLVRECLTYMYLRHTLHNYTFFL